VLVVTAQFCHCALSGASDSYGVLQTVCAAKLSIDTYAYPILPVCCAPWGCHDMGTLHSMSDVLVLSDPRLVHELRVTHCIKKIVAIARSSIGGAVPVVTAQCCRCALSGASDSYSVLQTVCAAKLSIDTYAYPILPVCCAPWGRW
jgi:hypothetical protein